MVIALACGFRRLAAGSLRTRASQRSLQVLDVLPLGGKRKLSVVRLYDRTFALGVGEREVTLVAELDPVTVEKPAVAGAGSTPTDFHRLLDVARDRLARRRTQQAERRQHEVVG